MAIAETAALVASLTLKDHFTPAANKAMASLGKLESTSFRVGQSVGKGLSNAAQNLAKIGVVAGGILAVGVASGIDSLSKLEDATTSVDGAIKQMGLTGKVTSQQIAGWANDIEANVGAAFDDKAITQAASTLIRFGNVTADNLHPALVVMTDLATKTGDVESAASLLAKALADPTKAAGKLSRQGIILTKQQQDQVKAFVKAGKTAQAQGVILDALSRQTAGAAKASQGPFKEAMSTLKDVTEDAERALAIGFLPVLQKVAGLLKGELAKPQTIANIKAFGTALAGGLDKLINLAQRLPWGAIGDSLRVAGAGAKTVLDAFLALPAWIQTAVITGWGLNKLTGGALGDIVGTLAGGLIKGVLGMTAGVVNINAGVVNGAGVPGVGNLPGAAAAGAAGIGLGTIAVLAIAPASIAALGIAITNAIDPQHIGATTGKAETATARGIPDWNNKALQTLHAIEGHTDDTAGQMEKLRGLIAQQAKTPKQADAILAAGAQRDKETSDAINTIVAQQATSNDIETLRGKIAEGLSSVDTSTMQAGRSTSIAATQAGFHAAQQTAASGWGIEGAIARNRPIINVDVQISATDITQVNVVEDRGGSRSGSRDGDGGGGPGQ